MPRPNPNLLPLLLTLIIATPSVADSALELIQKERNGRIEIVGTADQQLRYWVDRFGRVHSPEMTLAAEAYNDWVSSRFRGLFGVEPPSGSIEFVSHMPPGPRGIDPQTGAFRIPNRIHSDGALTRDLLSVPFFQLGVRLTQQWYALSADCKRIYANDAARCARFTPDLVGVAAAPGQIDDNWLEMRLRELRKARALLQNMQKALESIPMTVPGGQTFGYADDVARYAARLEECWTILRVAPRIDIFGTSGKFCTLHPEFAAHPPEWTTEHVEGEQITEKLTKLLASFEWQITNYLDAESAEADLTKQSSTKVSP
jgi:hypothetical protein